MGRLLKNSVLLVMIALTISAASAADKSMFNYQGRVLVQGIPYTGTGRMKVAIIATTGTSTVVSLWSNDGTSLAGSEPTNSFDVSVTGGVFDVIIGDPAISGMAAIPAIMFNRDDELKVRVWFNDDVHGYQLLTPDRRLTDPRRLGLTEVRSAITLYVNATTGNDLNSGIDASAPKKTIQAAVNMLPSRLFDNVTIDVADGIYRESTTISGITASRNKNLIIQGDTATLPTETVSPAVRITGTDNDSNHTKIRSNGIEIIGCRGIKVAGFLFDYFTANGIYVDSSSMSSFVRCKAMYSSEAGFQEFYGGYSGYEDCIATYNGYAGFEFTDTYASLTRSIASHNDNGVVATKANVILNYGAVIDNIYQGCKFWAQAQLVFGQFTPYVSIHGNGRYGVELMHASNLKWSSFVNYTGGNGLGNVYASTESTVD